MCFLKGGRGKRGCGIRGVGMGNVGVGRGEMGMGMGMGMMERIWGKEDRRSHKSMSQAAKA